jgi:hypothetical protein
MWLKPHDANARMPHMGGFWTETPKLLRRTKSQQVEIKFLNVGIAVNHIKNASTQSLIMRSKVLFSESIFGNQSRPIQVTSHEP